MKNNNIIRLKTCTILLCIIMILTACSSKDNDKKVVYDIDTETILSSMIKTAKDLPEMDYVNSDDESAQDMFEYICSFDYSKVEQFSFAKTQSGSPEEIVVVRLKDRDDMDELKKALEQRKSDRLEMFKTYMPESVNIVESGIIDTNSNYATLIICSNNQEVDDEFNNNFSD